MDDATYHKIIQNTAPSSSKLRAVIARWLHERNATANIDDFTKKQWEWLISRAKPLTTYKAISKDQLYGYEVLYTSPYHPELHPVETIWGGTQE
ncbi:hypothetical protein ON010_g1960 [Phytophthora cinnamomi]|nr:hypothetical protein ON010_g1960 [Phytophthora cinnamomi]